MNREQQERVADMVEYIQEALTDIINMGEGRDVEVCETEPSPQPSLEQVQYMENRAHYQPEISQVNNGFIVTMGCQRFVFETYDKMSKYLKMYFEDPCGTENKFHANELFK